MGSLDGDPDGVDVRGAAVGTGVNRSSDEESLEEETGVIAPLELTRTEETPSRGNRRLGWGTGGEELLV